MAVGLPAVATDVVDARELVADTGVIVAAGDPAALAAGISSLCPQTARRVAPEARYVSPSCATARASEKFSLMRSRLLSRLMSVDGSQPRPPWSDLSWGRA